MAHLTLADAASRTTMRKNWIKKGDKDKKSEPAKKDEKKPSGKKLSYPNSKY